MSKFVSQSPEEIVANMRVANLLFAAKRALSHVLNSRLEGATSTYSDLLHAIEAIDDAEISEPTTKGES